MRYVLIIVLVDSDVFFVVIFLFAELNLSAPLLYLLTWCCFIFALVFSLFHYNIYQSSVLLRVNGFEYNRHFKNHEFLFKKLMTYLFEDTCFLLL